MTAIRDTARVGNGTRSSAAPNEGPSFDALYREFAADLEAFCARRLGNLHDGQDAAHEVLLRAANSTWRGEASLRWWLGTIARNVCSDFARQRNRELPLGLATTTLRAPADSSRRSSSDQPLDEVEPGTVEEIAERRARGRLVRQAVTALPPRDRRYVELCYFDGLSYSDIARLDNTTSATVHGRLFRARQRLRNVIQNRAQRERLSPLPAVITCLPRLRNRWTNLRTRAAQSAFDLGSATTPAFGPLGGLLGHSAVHATAAVLVGAASLISGALTPSPANATSTAPVIDVSTQPLRDATPDSSSANSARSLDPGVSTDAPPSSDARAVTSTSTSSTFEPTDLEASAPASPTIETDAGDTAGQPLQQRDDTDGDSGLRTAPTKTTVDTDGDGDTEHEDTTPSVGMSCGNSDQHGPLTSAVCEATGEFSTDDPPDLLSP